jgi:hypothetical protein
VNNKNYDFVSFISCISFNINLGFVLLHITSDDKLSGHVILCEDASVWRLEISFYCFGLVPNVISVAYVIVKSPHDKKFDCCFPFLICLNRILWSVN